MLSATIGSSLAIGIFKLIVGHGFLQGNVVVVTKFWYSKTNSLEQRVTEKRISENKTVYFIL